MLVAGRAKNKAGIAFIQGLRRPGDDLRKVLAEDVRNSQADQTGAPAGQAPRAPVGDVPQLADMALDHVARHRGDVRTPIEYARDGCDRDTGTRGDVAYRRTWCLVAVVHYRPYLQLSSPVVIHVLASGRLPSRANQWAHANRQSPALPKPVTVISNYTAMCGSLSITAPATPIVSALKGPRRAPLRGGPRGNGDVPRETTGHLAPICAKGRAIQQSREPGRSRVDPDAPGNVPA
jgi:hypothetical protein